MSEKVKTAVIIGAGPAGLTAAFELITKTDIVPVIIESTSVIGGISQTIDYKGNKIDIGGHRFFSKSDVVMNWWLNFFSKEDATNPNTDPDKMDKVMLVRHRLSRILFLKKFFDYPVTLSLSTIKNLGLWRVVKIGISYGWSVFVKRTPERNLEDFFINRFGKELYKTFFKSYTEKVWGVACNEISPQWGGQRIKGLSVTKAIYHALRYSKQKTSDLSQKDIETSLISLFLYPKFGPGQLWEEVADQIVKRGGKILLQHQAINFQITDNNIISCKVKRHTDLETLCISGDYFFSSMPVCDLISGMGAVVPENVKRIANGLIYRDFITVGVLLDKVKIKDVNSNGMLKDNWIYIQEADVKVGRIQIFNNWSPYLVKDKNKIWIGMEYFCFSGDELWNMPDEEFKEFAVSELEKIGFADRRDVLDSVVIKMPKTYPCYFGTYPQMDEIINYVDTFKNLFLIGRNGMHKYNNQDHSMLTAIVAVENIINGVGDKKNIWEINLEDEYHEEKGNE